MEKDLLAQVRDDFKACSDHEAEMRKAAQDDLEFSLLSKQWDQADIDARKAEGRPALTINRLRSFGNQVINDAKMNRAAISVKPLGDGATKDTADICSDLIRNIEVQSQAEVAYDTALTHSVFGGFGYSRVSVDYTCDDAWYQDIFIERISNPFSVYGDPYGKELTSIDWNRCFVTDFYEKSEFERRWGKDRKAASFESGAKGDFDADWFKDERIRVAEHWTREEVPAKLIRLVNPATGQSQVMYEEALLRPQDDDLTLLQVMLSQGFVIEGDRPTKTYKVKQRLVTGTDVLEESDWLGKYIPIIPMYGEEVTINGKRHFISLIRRAKDAQRMYNYHRTSVAEALSLTTKAPWLAASGQIENHMEMWQNANRTNFSALVYDHVDGVPPPQRLPFAGAPVGQMHAALGDADDIKAVIGMFDASLGQRSNETSGRAILARQREGDTSTFHFIDNRNRHVEHVGRIVLDLIPHYYTVGRIIRGIQEDGASYNVPVKQPVVNQSQLQSIQQGQQPQPGQMEGPPQYVPVPQGAENDPRIKSIIKIFDPTTGKYDVTVSAGPSFTTRREETAAQMMEFIRVFPQAAPLIGDLLAKHLDWAGAEQIAERLKAALPPQFQGQVHPMVMQLQQLMQQKDQHAQQLVGRLQQEVQKLSLQLQDKAQENAIAAKKLEIDAFDAETKRIQATKQETPQQPVVDPLEQTRLALQEQEIGIKAFDAETKRIDTVAKAKEVETQAAAVYAQQVEIPQAQLAQSGEQQQAFIAALQQLTQALAAMQSSGAAPRKKTARAVRQPDGNFVLESLEETVMPMPMMDQQQASE